MQLSTLCYIEQNNRYLMLHRTKKDNDPNHDKWVGIGGKFESDESPDECLLREVKEETGLTLLDYDFRGIVTFISNKWETEYMHLFTASSFQGELIDCNEGKLEWIAKTEVLALNIWEGDKLFLNRLNGSKMFFSLKLEYSGDTLINSVMHEACEAKFENEKMLGYERMYRELKQSQEKVIADMADLKAKGKTNSVTYKQLMVKKLNNQNIISMIEIYVPY